MKANKKQTAVVTLELTLEEARWLKFLVQNPMIVRQGNLADINNRRMRDNFWNALDEEGEVLRDMGLFLKGDAHEPLFHVP